MAKHVEPAVQFVGSEDHSSKAQPDVKSEQAPVAEKTTQQTEPPRTAPAGAIIPTMGWPAILYRFRTMRGRPDLVPGLSKKEQQLLAAKAADDREATIISWLENVFNTHRATVDGEVVAWSSFRGCIAVFCHAGNAGKTLLSVMFPNILASLTHASTILVPATKNPGSTTAKAGVDRNDTLSLLQVEKIILDAEAAGRPITSDEIKKLIARNKYGTYVLAQQQLPRDFDHLRLRRIVNVLKTLFDIVVLDTGNNVSEEDGVEAEAFSLADLPLFVCAPYIKPESPVLMGETMDSYAGDGDNTKLTCSIVVVTGTKPTDTVETWAKFAETRVSDTGVMIGPRAFKYRVMKHTEGDTPTGRMFFVDMDVNIENNPAPGVEDLSQRSFRSYLEIIAETIYRVGVMRKVDFGILEKILEAKRQLAAYDWREAAIAESQAEMAAASTDSPQDTDNTPIYPAREQSSPKTKETT